jgi:ribonucleoside-diphosphate reductase alpha chain
MNKNPTKTYTPQEVREETFKYFNGDDLATDVWIKKYCLKDSKSNLLEKSPKDMHERLASEFSRIEQTHPNPVSKDKIFSLLKDFKYVIPQGSPMYGIGNNHSMTSLSNCFVIGNNNNSDSYSSIMRTDEEQVQLMKRRGGVGHDISHLRPGGALANNTTLKGLSGATLYMDRYSNSTREVAQGDRRGALMLSIDVRHPDTGRFIDAKLDSTKVTGANISVKTTDEFMDAVKNDRIFLQTFPITKSFTELTYSKPEDLELNKLYEGAGGYYKVVKAKYIWDKIIKNAWKSAEPGVLFWDTVLNESSTKGYGDEWKEVSTNPCGEIPLNPYDSCRLLAMNLFSYVENPFTPNSSFNFTLFKEHAQISQRLMDDVIDLEIEKIDTQLNKIKNDPENADLKRVEKNLWEKIKHTALQGRRTGLGVTAEGDMLASLGYRYGSKEAIKFATEVHRFLAISSYESSIIMAKERGAFGIFDNEKEKNNNFVNRIKGELSPEYLTMWEKYGRRNIANLTIAPTGTVSLMTQTTSGIEPLFQPYYKRRTKVNEGEKYTFMDEVGDGWVEYFVFHPKFIDWFKSNYWASTESKTTHDNPQDYLKECSGETLEGYFQDSPWFGSTSNDIDWADSVDLQGSIQTWIDHSISKTVNIPESVTPEEVNEIYLRAYEAGCKGCTIYRDGSRSGVLISTKNDKPSAEFKYTNSYQRPEVTECDIYHKTALKKDWTVLVGKVNGNPYEIFVIKRIDNNVFPNKIIKGSITKIKSKTYKLEGEKGEESYTIDNITSLMDLDERVNTRKYSSMLRHGMNPEYIVNQIEEYATIISFDKVVQRVLRNYSEDTSSNPCPECKGENYTSVEGCWACKDCGYAKCG